MLDEVSGFLLDAKKKGFARGPHEFLETVEKDHGRIETRRYWITEEVGWFQDSGPWEGLRSFGMVESLQEIDGLITRETRFFLASISAANAQNFARAVCGHWDAENSLHWSLDVYFSKDACRIRAVCAAENMAFLRHIVLNVFK